MNTDQIKGSARDLTGKLQEAAGKAVDSDELQAKGLQNQVLGSAEKAVGDAKDAVKHFTEAVLGAAKAK